MRRVLNSVHIDIDVRILFPGFRADPGSFVDITGDVGGGHTAQEAGPLINEIDNGCSVHAACLFVDVCHAQLQAVHL